jgi:hypothetical protein
LRNSRIRILLRNFAVEALIYAALVVGYFVLVLRVLGEPLKTLFMDNLTLYAFVALALIVVQGAILDLLTSFLISRLRLESLE